MSVDRRQPPIVDSTSIVALLGDRVRGTIGTAAALIAAPAPLDRAGPGTVTFCSASGDRALSLIAESRASIVLCRALASPITVGRETMAIVVDDPRLEFIRIVNALFAPPSQSGVHPTAIVHPDATIAGDAFVGPGAYIGRSVVGPGSVVHGRVFLYDGVHVGANVIIHAGTVIGADGFGYQRDEGGQFAKFPHLGGVTIEDDVEIGANTCIDRGTLGDTLVRQGAKIDNFVHIAHNVVVGRHTAVIAHAMIGGSTSIGDYAWIAPCACVRDGLTIGDGATVGLGAVVVKDVPANAIVMGAPARDATEYKRLLARMRDLSEPPKI